MIVHFVGAGPGDPELLTRKAERLLATCRICVYAGSLVSPGVLALIPDGAERHDSAGMSHGEQSISAVDMPLLDLAKAIRTESAFWSNVIQKAGISLN